MADKDFNPILRDMVQVGITRNNPSTVMEVVVVDTVPLRHRRHRVDTIIIVPMVVVA